jgi:hypothetical protein
MNSFLRAFLFRKRLSPLIALSNMSFNGSLDGFDKSPSPHYFHWKIYKLKMINGKMENIPLFDAPRSIYTIMLTLVD